jgi:nucleoside-diphosphate-sugar epimerase
MHEPNFECLAQDLRAPGALDAALEDIDTVVHLAALVGDAACRATPSETIGINLEASIELFERSRKKEVSQFIFASTCSNYGKAAGAEARFAEDSPLTPLSLYAETKCEVESYLQRQRESSRHIAVLRFATLFGLSPRPRLDLTVNDFTAQLWKNHTLEVYDPHTWRPYLHVRDAVRAIRLVMTALRPENASPHQTCSVWNVGNSRLNFEKKAIAQIVSETVGRVRRSECALPAAITYLDPEREGSGDERNYRVDFSRIEKELGFYPRLTLEDGISEIVHALEYGVISDPGQARYRNS